MKNSTLSLSKRKSERGIFTKSDFTGQLRSGFLCGVFSVLSFLGCTGRDQSKKPFFDDIQPYEAWDYRNNPLLLSQSYERVFSKLPKAGDLSEKKIPWADSYWPTYQGGISFRWNSPYKIPFSQDLYSYQSLKTWSPEQLATLSPAEKYDIFMGRYDYPLTQSEWRRTHPQAAQWEGLCHGWSAAAAVYNEPVPTTVTNPQGLAIPFGSSDIKALVTLFQGQYAKAPMRFLGLRCNHNPEDVDLIRASPECKGTNAGAFHIVLANQISIIKEAFHADVSRSIEVWNHPIYAFQTTPLGKRAPTGQAAPGTTEEVIVETKVRYTIESQPQWHAHGAGSKAYSRVAVYRYALELDAQGQILGGQWLAFGRPDFLWTQQRANFTGYFSGLARISPNL